MNIDCLLFGIFQKSPVFIRHIFSKILFNPKISKTARIFGWTIFGPNVQIGEYSYLHHPRRLDNIKIGKFCSIAEGFYSVSHRHKFENFFNYKFDDFYSPFYKKYKRIGGQDISNIIEIGDDVYIGCNVTILGGVKIKNGSIIAAGSVVSSDVPSHAIYGGGSS